MKSAILLLCAALVGGCALNQQGPGAAPQQLFADARFAAPSERIDTSELFRLSPDMRAYLRTPHFRSMVRSLGAQRGLIDALYKEGELKLDYDATQTRPAAETFDRKSGNCLSLVIMTAALARDLGLNVSYQDVRVDETWSRLGSLYVANTHVNVVLGWRRVGNIDGSEYGELFVVDFLQQQDAAKYRSAPLTETAIIGMYANNRAAEALAAGSTTNAYWWARKALEVDPESRVAYNTLGVVYQRQGLPELAERSFREVLARDPASLIAMHNLVPVLEQLGKADDANAMRARVAKLDPEPPFHYFVLGKAAMDRKDFRTARELFAREVAREPYYHEFHFWYALASLQLGDPDTARKELALAQQTSTTPDNRARYSAKLEHMKSLLAAPRRR